MAAVATLITLEPPAIVQSMLMAIAAGTAEPIGPARFLQSSLTLLFDAVEPLERRQGETFLNWIALRAMNKLVSMYHSMTPRWPLWSELGNQIKL